MDIFYIFLPNWNQTSKECVSCGNRAKSTNKYAWNDGHEIMGGGKAIIKLLPTRILYIITRCEYYVKPKPKRKRTKIHSPRSPVYENSLKTSRMNELMTKLTLTCSLLTKFHWVYVWMCAFFPFAFCFWMGLHFFWLRAGSEKSMWVNSNCIFFLLPALFFLCKQANNMKCVFFWSKRSCFRDK